jgi:type I restriction enzyme R subunit
MILSNDKKNDALRLDEKQHVENPLLDQLENLGWTVLRLEQKQEPQQSFRQNFAQVVLLLKLEEALRKINLFLRDDREQQASAPISAREHHCLRQPRHRRSQPDRPLRGFPEPGEQLLHRDCAV